MNQDRTQEIFHTMNPPPQHTNDQSHLFLRDKQAWENAIASYNGPDPLELWYNYICWYDYNIHIDPENKFRESLEKCLTIFEHTDEYKQDVRVIKLWVKYIDLQPNPLNLYQILYQRGIGTQCSCFYIGWAHYYDSANAFKQAESVFNLGFQAKAEPYSELQDAHTKFRLSLSQRMLYDDNSSKKRSASHLNEQRQQITTLTPATKKHKLEEIADVPQVNNVPHQPHNNQYQHNSAQIPSQQQLQPPPQQQQQLPHQSTTQQTQSLSPQAQSQLQMTSLNKQNVSTLDQCNLNNSAYVISSSLNYIYDETGENANLQDESAYANVDYKLENAKIPANFPRYAKTNHETWRPPICLEEPYDPNRICVYQKTFVYPGNGVEYSPEEIRSRKWEKRLQELQEQKARETAINQQEEQQRLTSVCNVSNTNIVESPTAPSVKIQHHSYSIQQESNSTIVSNCSNNGASETDFEEQIEASTIRFSTDANGATKNKTITIKFRREKPANDQSVSSASSGSMAAQNYTIYRPTTTDQRYIVDGQQKKYDYDTTDDSRNVANVNHFAQNIPTITPKQKKIKKIKIINNYDDPKYIGGLSASNSNSSCDYYANTNSGPHKSKYNSSSTTSMSRNQYEDANLLLSIANMHSNDGTATPYSNGTASTAASSTNTSETLAYNDDSISNSEFTTSFNDNGYISNSNCSTPIRKLSQSFSKTSTPQYFRSLKKHTSNLSLQNDDSMCSYEQNSFFASEHNDELRQKRLDKALLTIETHLSKQAIDPFNTELCKAFLTKIDFPTRDADNSYKLVNTPIPKLANTKTTTLDNITFSIEKEVGRGSYGSVYKATNVQTGAVVALKYQKPPNTWEVYICTEVRKRISSYDILPGFMDISTAIIAPNASILVTEFSAYGSLLDINNKLRQATHKVMHESLVMHFSSQILNIVSHLHSCNIIHADIKPDNFLLMRVPNADTHIPSLRLIDFGCAIDMTLFPEKTQFKKVIQTDGFTCIEMQEGRSWSYQTDLFCIAGTIHVMLFGDYMQLVKKFGLWDIKQKLPRYLKKIVWTEFFSKMLNIKDVDNMPNLLDMKGLMDDEVCKMESELQNQIRTLSNLLHRR